MQTYLDEQRNFYKTGVTHTYTFRKNQLIKLKNAIIAHEDDIKDALKKDLNKSSFEAYSTEIGFCLYSISKTLKKLKRWMKPKRVKTPIYMPFTKSYIRHEPLGSVLIIGPYNYPFQLVIEPLIGVIAAGNTAIIKPSEMTSNTEKIISKIITDTFNPSYIRAVTGDHVVAKELTSLQFDHIFFTGSERVGQMVYEAASKNLVPVTLELGGKSPTIVTESAQIDSSAKRIVFGKFINAGQTCIAPDYIFVHHKIKDAFTKALIKYTKLMYDDPTAFGQIVNLNNFERISQLIDKNKVIHGGQTDQKTRYISPTILDNVTKEDDVMASEIFGPILPIMGYDDIQDVISYINTGKKPLALYLFTTDKALEDMILTHVPSGGAAINETILHVANANLPFGGVGSSGFGKYHGKASFDCFSNQKGYIKKSPYFDLPVAYPPYDKKQEKLVKKILK